MPPSPRELPIAHVHAPRFPEDPIEIIGTRRGLKHLIYTLIDAGTIGVAISDLCDAEGHDTPVRVTCLRNGGRRPEQWRRSGSPLWDVNDPLIARIVALTDENQRLRESVAALRRERKGLVEFDHRDRAATNDGINGAR
jgi:hypothetical protein